MTALQKRASVLRTVREFFFERNVLEVETPSLYPYPTTEPNQQCFALSTVGPGDAVNSTRYLQPSPEYAMKRLLAADSGSIYQICKAFRNGECGRRHNPEFTMLEWYRVGFDYIQLMDEVDSLVQVVLNTDAADRTTYRELFEKRVGIDPFSVSVDCLREATKQRVDYSQIEEATSDVCLELLMSHIIEPQLGKERPIFVYDYPASQASLARVRDADVPVAERFELYYRGYELANGFHELVDADEQLRRFQSDLVQREWVGLPRLPVDDQLIAALRAGLPACSGVALGIDRLLMIACGVETIDEVLAFPWNPVDA